MQDIAMMLPGLGDRVHDAQSVFRSVMDAFAKPATIVDCPIVLESPDGLMPSAAALLLSLADNDTVVWIDPQGIGFDSISSYLRFHTGAPATHDPEHATFAIVDGKTNPDLSRFAAGTQDYPDRSATIIVQVDQLHDTGLHWNGPGLQRSVQFSAAPLWQQFEQDMRANRILYPCGLDFVFASATQLAAIPRSLRIEGESSCM